MKELCPGVETTVTVNYPERRRTLLTTTEGAWDKANRTCPGLTLTTRTQASYDTYSAKLTIPCNSTGGWGWLRAGVRMCPCLRMHS